MMIALRDYFIYIVKQKGTSHNIIIGHSLLCIRYCPVKGKGSWYPLAFQPTAINTYICIAY